LRGKAGKETSSLTPTRTPNAKARHPLLSHKSSGNSDVSLLPRGKTRITDTSPKHPNQNHRPKASSRTGKSRKKKRPDKIRGTRARRQLQLRTQQKGSKNEKETTDEPNVYCKLKGRKPPQSCQKAEKEPQQRRGLEGGERADPLFSGAKGRRASAVRPLIRKNIDRGKGNAQR